MLRLSRLRLHFNNGLITVLSDIGNMAKSTGEVFRANAYFSAVQTIKSLPKEITCIDDVKDKPGIGKSMMLKIEEYLKTGTLKQHKEMKKDPKMKLMELFTSVHGIGPVMARKLVYEKGFTKLSDLKKIELHEAQKLGLQHLQDTELPIPRAEVTQHVDLITKTLKKNYRNDVEVVACGSYRRGKPFSGDVDVLIAVPDDPIDCLEKATHALREKNVIHATLAQGPTKFMGYIKGPEHVRRFDMRCVKFSELPAAILYFTGSKAFNTKMRAHALEQGYTLSEYGLCSKKLRGKKLQTRKASDWVKVKSEEDIFKKIKMPYVKPEDRSI